MFCTYSCIVKQCKFNPMNFVVLTATSCSVSVVFTTSYTLNFLLLFRFKRFFVLLRSIVSPSAIASRFLQICICCLHRTFFIISIFSVYPSFCRTSSIASVLLKFLLSGFPVSWASFSVFPPRYCYRDFRLCKHFNNRLLLLCRDFFQ